MSCWSESMLAHAGKEILEGCPPGQQEAARKMLQEQSVPVITEALVTRVGLTEDQPASTSQPSRKTVTLKTPATDSQASTLTRLHVVFQRQLSRPMQPDVYCMPQLPACPGASR